MKLKMPFGYELRLKRSDKTESCEHWLPEDALYDAAQAMEGKKVTSAVVVWREEDGKGGAYIRGRRAGAHYETLFAMTAKLGNWMRWDD